MTRPGRPSLADRWTAAQRLRLARTRPATPSGDVRGEARLYADVTGPPLARSGLSARVGRPDEVAARTKVIDAEVSRAVGRRVAQIVLLGSDYDGRALRFAGGPARWFELDRLETLSDKRRRLAALGLSPSVTYVSTDLGDGGSSTMTALDAAGHDATQPSLFVCESGFTLLTLEATASLCEALRVCAPEDSVLVATFVVTSESPNAPVQALRRATTTLSALAGDKPQGEFRPGDPEKLMVVTGWHVAHTEAATGRLLDRGAHQRVLVCEPDPLHRTFPT